ncbi:MAG: glycosyltransferase family 1 protein [Planctomycetota bacterium]|nr:MAG: glycosyltransferase family 1 protein [Planctomycetota bacterium]
MKVLVDLRPLQSPDFAERGIGTYARNMLRVLNSRFEGSMDGLSADNFPRPDSPLPESKARFYRPKFRKLVPFNWLFDRIVISAKLCWSDYDLLHILEPFRHALTLPRRSRTRVVCTVYDLIPIIFPEHYFPGGIRGRVWSMGERFNSRLIPRIDRIIAISENTKRDLVERLGVEESRISVVYQSVDGEVLKPDGDPERDRAVLDGLNIPEKFILYVGDVDWRKDIASLARALARLKSPGDKDVPLVMAGGTIAERESHAARGAWEAINNAGVAGRVITPGFVPQDELASLYRSAACLVFPSVYEGFGLPPLEAMACGCPVVTTDASSLPEVVGDAGILFHPGDDAACAEAIMKILDDGETASEMRDAGLKRAERFSDENFAGGVIAAYHAAKKRAV